MNSAIGSCYKYAAAKAILAAAALWFGLAPAHADETSARGAYLARITGCLGCHSPRKPDGGLVEGQLLSGGDHPIHVAGVGPIYPANISSDATNGIGGWSVADIAASIKRGVTPDGRTLSAGMPWRSQFSEMTDADVGAIAAYVKSAPAVNRVVPLSPDTARRPTP